MFYDHLVYFMAIGNILQPFGIFCGPLVYLPRFGMLYHEKSGNPAKVLAPISRQHQGFGANLAAASRFWRQSRGSIQNMF
jgi:hypothetical protein